jgi:hypothetical protein
MLIGHRGIWRLELIHISTFKKITFCKLGALMIFYSTSDKHYTVLLSSELTLMENEWHSHFSIQQYKRPVQFLQLLNFFYVFPWHPNILIVICYHFSFLHVFFITCTCSLKFFSFSEDWNFIFPFPKCLNIN